MASPPECATVARHSAPCRCGSERFPSGPNAPRLLRGLVFAGHVREPAVLSRRVLIALGVVLFLAISFFLARFLSVENTERDADLALIEAEARGDSHGMIQRLSGCSSSPACLKSVSANVANPRLRRAGAVKILQLTSSTAYSLTGATGRTRLAWTVIGQLPVVQCIGVRRTGNAVSGIKVALTSLSAPIPNEADC
jgi:hypothetical protein